MYLVDTIGALGDAVELPVHATSPNAPASVDVAMLAGIGAAGVLVGALGFWALSRMTKGKRR